MAWQWGCSVAEAKARMPAAEMEGWVAFFEKEPSGPQACNQQFAAFAAIACSLLRNISNGVAGTKIKTKFEASDFMGGKRDKPVPSAAELETKLHIWAARANAALKQRGAA